MDQLPIWRPSKELLAVQAISRKITLLVLYTLTLCQNLKHQLKIKQGIGDQKAGLTSSSLTPFLPEVQKQEKENNIARTVFLSIIILPLLFIYYSICFALSCLDCFHTSYFISSHFISSQWLLLSCYQTLTPTTLFPYYLLRMYIHISFCILPIWMFYAFTLLFFYPLFCRIIVAMKISCICFSIDWPPGTSCFAYRWSISIYHLLPTNLWSF